MIVVNDPTYPLYPVLSGIGFVLCVIPLPWHIQAWNSGTCAFMFWTAITCLCGFINSVVWRDSLQNHAPVWCDISSKVIIGFSVGAPAASLCISRRLYYLTSGNYVSITRAHKRRMVFIDLAITFGIPVVIMTLHYVVQGHRFDILEDIGCYPVVYNTLPAYFLYIMWPMVLSILSGCFSVMTLYSFWKRRLQFSQLVTSHNSMSISRFMRLILLSLVVVFGMLPLAIYSIYRGSKGVTLAPWISWEDTHYNFSRVGLIPTVYWYNITNFRTGVELTRWIPVVGALLFFALFGFATEAMKHYKLAFWGFLKVFGVTPKPTGLKPFKSGQHISLGHWKKPKGASTTADTTGTVSVQVKPDDSYSWTPPPASATVSHFSDCSSPSQQKSRALKPYDEQDCKGTFLSSTATEVYLDPAPGYYASLPSQTNFIGVPIRLDLDLDLEKSQVNTGTQSVSRKASAASYLHSIEEADQTDIASISTHSYYSAPFSPAVRLSPPLASLPPPPRRMPRDVPMCISEPIEVPSDILEPSFLPSNPMSLTPPPSHTKMLGINNGTVIVTISKQASVDNMA